MSSYSKWRDEHFMPDTVIYSDDDMELAYNAGLERAVEIVKAQSRRCAKVPKLFNCAGVVGNLANAIQKEVS